MLESVILYSIGVFFAFYLLNYSDMLNESVALLLVHAPSAAKYTLSCPICFAFWVTAALWMAGFINDSNGVFILVAPPIVLFLDLLYSKLKA